ncbi:PREDICTED: V-type proton ATPase 116 kDa subunit a-like [Rhagoletis zephyria]|uniref:V-type proton ATPase 116 kDa subunit a-like n=1 Tax=Rhagoletis zephyria TaxID=28612 RepID=UPI000811705B|nr:PREDICTED: V-type proton ATPase 116 kDa subunit a-like [Rhagoletis zephyria]
MFGDTGHGIIMTLFALWMVWKERQLASVKDEIFSMFYGGRYIILLMGLFSMYTGLIYNDIFSKSINLFGSSFSTNEPDVINGTIIFNNITQGLIPYENMDPNYVYWFGIDPVWQLAQNKVIYLNTYKMKVSVILGVLQMFFGVVLSLFNHIHFRKPVSIMFEFIPQLIFLIGIFGYMDFMIIWKWFNYSSSDSAKAPSVLITLINMFMFRMPLDNDPPYLKEEMFDGQYSIIQPVCLILAVVCIPIMLIVKPVYNHCIKKSSGGGGGGHDGHDGDGSFGDAFINQAIHTIEYCLGSVSHTASYLRLWALSLAHAQLSEVLWNMVMKNGFMEFHHGPPNYLNIVSGAVMFVVFSIWAVLTVAILIVMEGLSAFLHALRLHWVEFMSKFYSGAGIVFMPFSFRVIIDEL